MKIVLLQFIVASLLLSCSHVQITHARVDEVRASQMLKRLRKSESPSVVYLKVRVLDGINDEIEETLDYGRFFILNKSIYEILNDMDLVPTIEGEESTEKEAYLEAAARSLLSATDFSEDSGNLPFFSFGELAPSPEVKQDEESMLVGILLGEYLKKNRVSEFSLNQLSEGAIFTQKRTGEFIFGYGILDGFLFVWEIEVDFPRRQTEIKFDQYNARVLTHW